MVFLTIPSKRATIYCRVSTESQEENTSLGTQEAACRQYAIEKDYTVNAVYRDVHSGYELWERPAMRQLLDAIRLREYDAVICHALDRLSRKQTHIAILVDECERAGVALLFVTEEFEKSAVGDFIRSAKAFAAEFEREKIRERMQRGLRSRIESGKPLPGSRPLYGYRWRDEEKSGLLVDPRTEPIVQRIFSEIASGSTLRRVATGLSSDRIPTPSGKAEWKASTIHAIVGNRSYIGEAEALRWSTTKVAGGGRHLALREGTDRVALPAGTIPALIDPETFAAIGLRLSRNKITSAGRLHDPETFLLRGGYVKCGYCGNAVSAKWSTQRLPDGERGKIAVYALSGTCDSHRDCCGISIRADILDARVWSRVEEILTQPERVVAEVARMRETDSSVGDLAALDRAIAETQRRRTNLGKRLALFDDDEDAAPIVVEMKSQGRRLQDLQDERTQVLTRHEGWQATQDRLADLERWCKTVAKWSDMSTYKQKRLTLDALGIRVKLYRRDHNPRFEITTAIDLSTDGRKEAPPTTLGRSVSGTLASPWQRFRCDNVATSYPKISRCPRITSRR